MNVLTTNPRADGLATLHDRVARLVPQLFDEYDSAALSPSWAPAMDLLDLSEELVVQLEIPGIDPDTVETSLNGDYLEIRGEKPAAHDSSNAKWYRFERTTGPFHRRVRLPFPIDADKVEATAKDGLMTIRLPKHPTVLPRRIQIKVS